MALPNDPFADDLGVDEPDEFPLLKAKPDPRPPGERDDFVRASVGPDRRDRPADVMTVARNMVEVRRLPASDLSLDGVRAAALTDAVTAFQKERNKINPDIVVDGVFGPQTQQEFQPEQKQARAKRAVGMPVKNKIAARPPAQADRPLYTDATSAFDPSGAEGDSTFALTDAAASPLDANAETKRPEPPARFNMNQLAQANTTGGTPAKPRERAKRYKAYAPILENETAQAWWAMDNIDLAHHAGIDVEVLTKGGGEAQLLTVGALAYHKLPPELQVVVMDGVRRLIEEFGYPAFALGSRINDVLVTKAWAIEPPTLEDLQSAINTQKSLVESLEGAIQAEGIAREIDERQSKSRPKPWGRKLKGRKSKLIEALKDFGLDVGSKVQLEAAKAELKRLEAALARRLAGPEHMDRALEE